MYSNSHQSISFRFKGNGRKLLIDGLIAIVAFIGAVISMYLYHDSWLPTFCYVLCVGCFAYAGYIVVHGDIDDAPQVGAAFISAMFGLVILLLIIETVRNYYDSYELSVFGVSTWGVVELSAPASKGLSIMTRYRYQVGDTEQVDTRWDDIQLYENDDTVIIKYSPRFPFINHIVRKAIPGEVIAGQLRN